MYLKNYLNRTPKSYLFDTVGILKNFILNNLRNFYFYTFCKLTTQIKIMRIILFVSSQE